MVVLIFVFLLEDVQKSKLKTIIVPIYWFLGLLLGARPPKKAD